MCWRRQTFSDAAGKTRYSQAFGCSDTKHHDSWLRVESLTGPICYNRMSRPKEGSTLILGSDSNVNDSADGTNTLRIEAFAKLPIDANCSSHDLEGRCSLFASHMPLN